MSSEQFMCLGKYDKTYFFVHLVQDEKYDKNWFKITPQVYNCLVHVKFIDKVNETALMLDMYDQNECKAVHVFNEENKLPPQITKEKITTMCDKITRTKMDEILVVEWSYQQGCFNTRKITMDSIPHLPNVVVNNIANVLSKKPIE